VTYRVGSRRDEFCRGADSELHREFVSALVISGGIVVEFHFTLDLVKQRGHNREITAGGISFGDLAHIDINPEYFVDYHYPAYWLIVRRGDPTVYGAVFRYQCDPMTHLYLVKTEINPELC
jgi:hypothetical protein